MQIFKKSPFSGVINSMEIDCTMEQYKEFENGSPRYIQDIFPNVPAEEREFIKTGITPQEWDEIF